jgi:hypothetical protein
VQTGQIRVLGAEELGLRGELRVDFEADDEFVLGHVISGPGGPQVCSFAHFRGFRQA